MRPETLKKHLNNPVESALAALQDVLSASEIKELEKLLRENQ